MGEVPRPPRDADLLQQFGDRLRSLRAEAQISQERLSELAGLHRTYIGHIERGAVAPTIQTVVRLAEALGRDPGELVARLHSGAAEA